MQRNLAAPPERCTRSDAGCQVQAANTSTALDHFRAGIIAARTRNLTRHGDDN